MTLLSNQPATIFLEKFFNIMRTRGWKPVVLSTIDEETWSSIGLSKLRNSSNLAFSINNLNRIPSDSEYTTEDFFARNHDVKFKYKQDFITKVNKVHQSLKRRKHAQGRAMLQGLTRSRVT